MTKSISSSSRHRALQCHSLQIKLTVAGSLALLVIPFLTQLASPLLAKFRAPPETQTSQSFCAPFGDHRQVQIQDGSTFQVNSAACVTVEISATTRLVRLASGEAIFRVAPDPSRPFVVETGPISIRALGTQFDVYRKPSSTRIAVIEGAVQVTSPNTTSGASAKPLTVLEQIDVSDDPTRPMVNRDMTSSDFERMTAWVHGDIELDNQTLKESLEEFSRYQHIQINFKEKSIEEIRFGGGFHTNGLDSFVALLKFRCIRSQYDKAAQRITLSTEPGKRAGTACK